MSSHREIKAKTGLIRDPSLEQAALQPLAAMAKTVLESADQLARVQSEIGVGVIWLQKLKAQQISPCDIDARTIMRLAQMLNLPLTEVFPVNPYRRAIQSTPSSTDDSKLCLGRRLEDLDPGQLTALYHRATGALVQHTGVQHTGA